MSSSPVVMHSSCWRYWGKAHPETPDHARWHLLVLHALDVAAVMAALLEHDPRWLSQQADTLGLPPAQLRDTMVWLASLHDLGKFARSFQNLYRHEAAELVPFQPGMPYTLRHDNLGWLLRDAGILPELPPSWLSAVLGHHGQPPTDQDDTPLARIFPQEDQSAALHFVEAMQALLLPDGPPPRHRLTKEADNRFSWLLAGLVMQSDWLGSNQHWFPYHEQPPASLAAYWLYACQQARQAVAASGLCPVPAAPWVGAERLAELLPWLAHPTPLQQHAATVALPAGPQLFLLEDVTGAGKTEAALILAHRLLAAGEADGLYFALPTMATANQMYTRVGQAYHKLFTPPPQPSIMLAHSARRLVDEFSQSLHPAGLRYSQGQDADLSASLYCNQWLADSNKKTLLAHVGVGSIDQALLAMLPVRHQAMRMTGLHRKLLIVDEVHAYDDYILRLLSALLQHHATQGGSAILLSATLPLTVRQQLQQAFDAGLGLPEREHAVAQAYPLVTRLDRSGIHHHACDTRPEVRRQVCIQPMHDLDQVIAMIVREAEAGRCLCWIRNTVGDARSAWQALQAYLPPERLTLFHSRFAMGHRLEIENHVLSRLGKEGGSQERRGQVLIGTQVLEQSLDFDVDIMVSDLAPIDLLIQRAGRLQRHTRQQNGDRSLVEARPAPILYLYGPADTDHPEANWYSSYFPTACYVYPDSGKLWHGLRALLRAGAIHSPGIPEQAGGVRQLVEAVYGEHAEAIPPALQAAATKAEGDAKGKRSTASFNVLHPKYGYLRQNQRWDEEARYATRLGENSVQLYLATVTEQGELQPLCQSGELHLRWALSTLRLAERKAKTLHPTLAHQHATALQTLRNRQPLLRDDDLILPLTPDGQGGWLTQVLDQGGKEKTLRYSLEGGLEA
ncbi:CRISPR-associated helicase Cas3' [Leeia sp.]|uniref:CRISPR-associated helicase Cas3' n=1 Tax=Leeia sp. TaxID=2884678 RepID=UPI0035B44FFE